MRTLGRLERVSLREIWKSESSDFTPWLARADNMALLAETLRMDLETEAEEERVGPFRADILCKDTLSGAWVLIENQLERTDHAHLGQLITYAAGLEAVVIVWIAERFTDEHRAALDWLNELGNEKLRCFGLEVELWRIGASDVAPKFNVVSEPNDWTRSVASSAEHLGTARQSPTKQLQLEYWTAFAKALRDGPSFLRPQKPLAQTWMNVALGRTGIHLAAIASTIPSDRAANSAGEVRAEVIVDHPELSKHFFQELLEQKEEIQQSLGEELNWISSPTARGARISLKKAVDIWNRDTWAEQHLWLRTKLEALHREFSPRAKSLRVLPREFTEAIFRPSNE